MSKSGTRCLQGTWSLKLKRVPADACDNCGECYLSDDVTGELLERAEDAMAQRTSLNQRQRCRG
nr:YgiT-type zinc finger protein [Nodosilinea sp. P-1105]